MPASIRIMNWNIQNLGPTKVGVEYNNYDVLEIIARVIVGQDVDIAVLLELNTTDQTTAEIVFGQVVLACNEIAQEKFGHSNFYRTGILSPNTGKEFYGFIVKDTSVVAPLPMTGPTPLQPYLGQYAPIPVPHAQFQRVRIPPGVSILPHPFPLISPDVPVHTRSGRPSSPTPNWPNNTRYPCLGLFEILNASAPNRFLPIIACHFAAGAKETWVGTPASQEAQIRVLPNFSILQGVAIDQPQHLQINTGQGFVPQPMNMAMMTGDFNIDYTSGHSYYTPLTQEGMGMDLGYTACIHDNTHLVTYKDFPALRPKTTEQFFINNYDNFFIRGTASSGGDFQPAGGGHASRMYGNNQVINFAEDVRLRHLQLNASVRHYAALDQRGFSSSDYDPYIVDYANQLAGDPHNHITLRGALVGARLISDHAPVITQLQLS